MQDYRHNPEESPLAWCPWENKLVEVVSTNQIMKTVFHVSSTGVYPYVNKAWHDEMLREQKSYA